MKTLNKIAVDVEGDGEIPCHEREVYFHYFTKVIVNQDFEVIDFKEVTFEAYGRDGEEIELQIEEEATIKELIEKLAEEKALNKVERSSFEDEEEED